uniref:Uncharacterized protein n=1 Tax=Arundo donax TaxID=35708 RepID=A0A0A9H1C5_ARUDO
MYQSYKSGRNMIPQIMETHPMFC